MNTFDKFNDLKATRQEMMYVHCLIESLNERVKHLSVVQTELASSLVPVSNSIGKFGEEKKKRLLE